MAWLDDRIWCHPKLTDLTSDAFRTHINAIAYSSGFATGGRLSPGQQRTVGAVPRVVRELVKSTLWDAHSDGSISIHDWDEHNGKRDARKAADRKRKREARQPSAGASQGTSAGQSAGTSTGAAAGQGADKAADRSALNARRLPPDDGSDRVTNEGTRDLPALEVPALELQALPNYAEHEEGHETKLWTRLLAACGGGATTAQKLERTIRAHRCTERDVICATEAATGPGVHDPLGVALSELVKRSAERSAQVA